MSNFVRMCKKCNDNAKNNKNSSLRGLGYSTYLDENNYTCEVCGEKVIDLSMSSDDYNIIVDISSDPVFINAMIELHDKDIIEYELKMSQFKTQISQQTQQQESNQPHCPHCQNTNIKPISTLNRGASIAMWGIFSKKINKSFECKDCGYTW